MRVLHVYSGNLYGGIETILATIARTARGASSGVTHEFALCFSGRLSAELAAAGASVHLLAAVRLSRPQTARAARRALAQLLERERFDRIICHAPWSQGIFGGVARRGGVPLAFWAHDVMTGRHWTERLARRVAPDLVIGNSEYTLATVKTLYPEQPSRVVYAPVELPARASAAHRDGLRSELHTPADAVVIVQASRAEAWKGHLLLVDALAEIRNVPNWIWWLAGGAQRPVERDFLGRVQRAIVKGGIADRVRWLGQREDIPRVFLAADVYCQPNTSPEPFGVSFVEALAAGLPVVTTDIGGAREIVDASCGWRVAPDAHELAAALSRLVTDRAERARLAESAPSRAAALSTPSRQLDRLAEALESMTRAEAHA